MLACIELFGNHFYNICIFLNIFIRLVYEQLFNDKPKFKGCICKKHFPLICICDQIWKSKSKKVDNVSMC